MLPMAKVLECLLSEEKINQRKANTPIKRKDPPKAASTSFYDRHNLPVLFFPQKTPRDVKVGFYGNGSSLLMAQPL